jgi:uncharacterized protein YndB with AHSA1/START domain
VYGALLDARAVAAWRVPDGMISVVHELDPREGGRFRVSLTYDAPTGAGKTSPNTDTYHGCFTKLVPDEQVVEVVEFETTDPAMQGEMTITTTLVDADAGTEITVVFDGLPPGVPEDANATGTRMALANSQRWSRPAVRPTPGASRRGSHRARCRTQPCAKMRCRSHNTSAMLCICIALSPRREVSYEGDLDGPDQRAAMASNDLERRA